MRDISYCLKSYLFIDGDLSKTCSIDVPKNHFETNDALKVPLDRSDGHHEILNIQRKSVTVCETGLDIIFHLL